MLIQSTHQARKLIFVDDGSIDNSLIIAKRYEGVLNNLKILELRKNKGFAIALNAGIAESSAAYIARVDPDDILYPNRLYLQYQTISKGEIDVLGADRKSVVKGKSVSVRVDLGGGRIIKKKKKTDILSMNHEQ